MKKSYYRLDTRLPVVTNLVARYGPPVSILLSTVKSCSYFTTIRMSLIGGQLVLATKKLEIGRKFVEKSLLQTFAQSVSRNRRFR